ncbi:Eco57I restriction-modification methylase domain-containing protein [Chondromyces crocatus]|uniref:Eco57I restriction-modification methylase domain-containing protein n=1 Tax=Chondromyces crocatus TaxID=52 RepID=UPI0012E227F7|nr:hypothetical protein [Chondromyces crocatus]
MLPTLPVTGGEDCQSDGKLDRGDSRPVARIKASPSVGPSQARPARRFRDHALLALRELGEAFLQADVNAGGRLLAGQEALLTRGLTTVLLRLLVLLVVERVAPERLVLSTLFSTPERAWSALLALTRAVHGGAHTPTGAALPLPHGGCLFDPHLHPFLEGRPAGSKDELPEAPTLPTVPDAVLRRVLSHLAAPEVHPEDPSLGVDRLGALHEGLLGVELKLDGAGGFSITAGDARRRAGAHYTSRTMARAIVSRALAPLLAEARTPAAILALRICDPAMGAGAFLLETCRELAEALLTAWEDAGVTHGLETAEARRAQAHYLVAQHALHGVDKDPLAVDIARISLGLFALGPDGRPPFLAHALQRGDAILGLDRAQIAALTPRRRHAREDPVAIEALERATASAAASRRALREGTLTREHALACADQALIPTRHLADTILATFLWAERRARPRVLAKLPPLVPRLLEGDLDPELTHRLDKLRERHGPLHWELEFADVFAERGGFDAFVGNPPWVAYAGRAAQPIANPLRDLHAELSTAFSGYRTLQGLFVHRMATLLRPGGRLGLVLPTSMSDLAGYEPTRRAHDALCRADEALPDFGERAFEGVFQPSMGLLSTRRHASPSAPRPPSSRWHLASSDLDARTAELLARLDTLPRLSPRLFGERGFQTSAADTRKLVLQPDATHTVGLRAGSDVAPCLLKPPRFYCDPDAFDTRFRPAQEWRTVDLLIRQTARFPLAALSDGQAFRNSILAGFADEQYGAHFLLLYLNSTPVRWVHYHRQRDARQGMPQVKISHLRALPAPPADHPAVHALSALGRRLGDRNEGITAAEQEAIDGLVSDALSLDDEARALVGSWWEVVQRGSRPARGASPASPEAT